MLGLIWAQSRNGVIGRDGDMPWYVPEDLAHFKAVTSGHPVVMGRRTWDSLHVRPLPNRLNIVVSRGSLELPVGVVLAASLEDALAAAHAASDEVWCIGGGTLYGELAGRADRIELTELDLEVDGDTLAPAIPPGMSRSEGEWLASREGLRYRFVSLQRTQ